MLYDLAASKRNHTGSQSPSGIPAPAQQPGPHVVRRTRMGGWWVASALFALMLLLLLIFILENGQRADIGFFGAHGHLPLRIALLLAAILGVLLVVIPGTGRIIQLRMLARRHRKGRVPSPILRRRALPAVRSCARPSVAGAAARGWH
jgi:uncharacterized integral membrane protein